MAADLGLMSGHTSSLDITIISILFLIVYIALYTLCTTCFSATPECPEEKAIPSSLSLTVNPEDHWSTNRNMENVDAKSDSCFSQQMTPRIPDTPTFSVGSTGSVSPGLPALPPVPPIFCLTTFQVEPPMASSSGQQPKTVKTPPPEDPPNMNSGFSGAVSDEHPYACIDNVSVSGPSSPSLYDETHENQWESESPYHMVTEWTETANTCDLATFLPVTDSNKAQELRFIFPPLPAVQDGQSVINTDRTAIYAVVNRNTKSQKSIEEAPVEQDTKVLDENEAPPVPEKIFD
ncbi:uncharacterized protein LOC132883614 isoform X1 [Neoarius graeffei]|uniref:uncharacterized protein LOC132883614 isoform X1 n=1 Tax=Neoarius graeffei TaxID=443677 RepID=UPI00298C6F00|nr:uncharacterized protein LOC132883614 isoform X1 [Neoarius graeffei]